VPIVPPTATTPEYALVIFDKQGREVAEADGTALSETVAARVAAGDARDVVVMCHGWLDALEKARTNYGKWLGAAHPLTWPGERAPLVVGVHWPSTPLAPGEPPDVPAAMQPHLADGTLQGVLENAGIDVLDFLSFWTMRTRAIALGSSETGLARLLSRIFAADAGVRVHLVGHSLGCVALSGALTTVGIAERHAASFFLVQAAESSWAFSERVPFFTGGGGRYRAIVGDGLVDGPLVTTQSSHDQALTLWYRLGMEFVLQRSYATETPGRPHRAAAIGAEGLGFDPSVPTLHALPPLTQESTRFALAPGDQYTVDCSAIITGHKDVAHVELARLFFAMAGVAMSAAPPGDAGAAGA
jgi:hypothetical protein